MIEETASHPHVQRATHVRRAADRLQRQFPPAPFGRDTYYGPIEDRRLDTLAVERAKAGDAQGIRLLYLRHAEFVFRNVRTIVRDDHEAEDLTQQVFAKLIVSLGGYEPRSTPLRAWIARVAHNAAIDSLRDRRPTPFAEVLPSTTEDQHDAWHRGQDLTAALAGLPASQREVVVLRLVRGLSTTEIATRIGRSPSAVDSLHYRGRRSLRAELGRAGAAPVVARRRHSHGGTAA